MCYRYTLTYVFLDVLPLVFDVHWIHATEKLLFSEIHCTRTCADFILYGVYIRVHDIMVIYPLLFVVYFLTPYLLLWKLCFWAPSPHPTPHPPCTKKISPSIQWIYTILVPEKAFKQCQRMNNNVLAWTTLCIFYAVQRCSSWTIRP